VETRGRFHPRINLRADVRTPPAQHDRPMSPTDYILDSALVLLVLLQVRERQFTRKQVIRPLVIVGIAVATYLNGVPTAGNDLALAACLALIGGAIGIASGQTAKLRRDGDGGIRFRAGWASAVFWVLGMGSRFAFLVWISHGGATMIAAFSANHAITSDEAWTVGLLAMAVAEVLGRTFALTSRAARLRSETPTPLAA
jgi:hypothetical protein